MKLTFGYGKGVMEADIPEGNLIGVLRANEVESGGPTGAAEVARALASPIGKPRLGDMLSPEDTVAIVTSDITRPMPTALVLPPVLEEILSAGVKRENITLVFALGTHRPHTDEERRRLAGEAAYGLIKCVDSDPADCVRLGVTKRGTPVDITRSVASAKRRICLGNIEYHYFAGYSGGGKAIMPGVSTRAAIQRNHSDMVLDAARAGKIEGNPVREDIEEAAAMCGIDFIVNVVLDAGKRVVRAVAGDPVLAHREGCRFLDRMYACPIERLADIVITSPGGAPKDLNLYQTQKALDNAKHAVKPGGVIILVGECPEGLGERVFERWILEADSPDALIRRIGENFELGGHKAAAIAMVQRRAEVFVVSKLPEAITRRMSLRPFDSVQCALDAAFDKLGRDATVYAMPNGGSTLPVLN